jgi:hypothetical protein
MDVSNVVRQRKRSSKWKWRERSMSPWKHQKMAVEQVNAYWAQIEEIGTRKLTSWEEISMRSKVSGSITGGNTSTKRANRILGDAEGEKPCNFNGT